MNEVKPNRYLKSGVRVMQYCRSRAKGATFFFTLVTNDRKKILCNDKYKGLQSVSRLEKGEQGVYDSDWGSGVEMKFDAKLGYE